MAFNSAFRRFASTAASGKPSVYISSFLAVPVTYAVLTEDSFSPSEFLAGPDGVAGSKHPYGYAWSWPWSSSNPAVNDAVSNAVDAARKPGNSGKVFVRGASSSNILTGV